MDVHGHSSWARLLGTCSCAAVGLIYVQRPRGRTGAAEFLDFQADGDLPVGSRCLSRGRWSYRQYVCRRPHTSRFGTPARPESRTRATSKTTSDIRQGSLRLENLEAELYYAWPINSIRWQLYQPRIVAAYITV